MRKIDTRAYVSVLRELVEQGQEVSMLISGSSMAPFLIHERDSICFKQPERFEKGIWCFIREIMASLLCIVSAM